MPKTYKLLLLESKIAGDFMPSINAITFYKGIPPEAYLLEKLNRILTLNPWLTGRLAKEKEDTFLHVQDSFDVYSHYLSIQSNISSLDSPASLNSQLDSHIIPLGKTCIAKQLSLIRIVIVKNSKLNEFGLFISLCHQIADGSTFYAIHSMLSSNVEPYALIFDRNFEYQDCMKTLTPDMANDPILFSFGYSGYRLFTLFIGLIVFICLRFSRLFRKVDPYRCNVSIIKKEWLEKKRKEHCVEGGWISTNDIISSEIFRATKCELNVMAINLRNRFKPIGNMHAGNYESVIYYRDAYFPEIIREALKGEVFTSSTLLKKKRPRYFMMPVSFITTWAGFYKDVLLEGCALIKHMPILYGGVDVYPLNWYIIFSPKKGEYAVFSISKFESDMFYH